jgi:signal transduction histidine kinase/phage shock protein PspC (stress-responsive transcriptional regulator)
MAPSCPQCDHRDIPHRHRRFDAPPWAAPHQQWAAYGSHGPGRPWGRPKDRGPIRRRRDGRFLGGVASGLASRIGVDVTLVRIALVLFGLASGAGVAAYVVAWLLVPVDDEPEAIGARALGDGRGLALVVGLVPLLVVSLLVASALQAPWVGSLAWPAFVSAAGLVLVWRNGSDDERTLLRRAATPLMSIGGGPTGSWQGLVRRLAVGVLLAVGGVAVLTVGHRNALFRPLGGVGLVLAAFVVIFGPWWLNVGRELVVERQARMRAEERADLAARVHDSVLQTLALIQRNADQPQRVAQLARAQERELRTWLFEGQPPGSFDGGLGTVAAVVRRIQGDVEAAHGVRVEAVVVGDCPLTPEIEALLAAGREATVNAAKWSGAEVVSLFAEVEPGKVSLFVRDRGRGFDPLAVAADRRGITESIEGRMGRAGGRAIIRTSPGGGTEVELSVPRAPAGPPRRGAAQSRPGGGR